MRFIEIPALITEDIEDPSIVDITEPITASISGTTMTIDGGSKVSGEATVTLTGDTTVNAFTLQNVKQPSIHKISVKTNRKGNFTYVPNITVTASSVSTTTKTGSDFEILLITTTGGETYVDFDMADYVSPALYTSNALTGFDISELTSTYGATAKLYKPDGTLLTTVTSATTGDGVNFGYTESTPQDVTYTLEVEDDLGRTSRYDLPRKWISYAMSSPGFEKLALAGNEYTSTTIVPNISPSSKVRVHKTGNHGYLGINFKIQGRNSTNGAWVDIDDTGENENDDESKEFLAFGDYLYHRVWVKPTAKATTTVSSSNVVTLTLTDFTEENVTTSFTGVDPFDLNESTNTYVFEETTKIGTIPFTVTLGTETYTNAVTATTEGTAYDYVTIAFANPTLSLTTSNVTISSAKLYRDDVLFHTYGTVSNVVLRSDQTGTYQAIVNDVYYSNRVTPDFTTTRSVSAPQLEFDGYNKLTLANYITTTSDFPSIITFDASAWGTLWYVLDTTKSTDTSKFYETNVPSTGDAGNDGTATGIEFRCESDGTTKVYANTDDNTGQPNTLNVNSTSYPSNYVDGVTVTSGDVLYGVEGTFTRFGFTVTSSMLFTRTVITPTSTTLGLPDGTTRDLTTQSSVYIYETGTYTANVQTSDTFAYLSNVVTSQPSQNSADVGPTFTFDGYNRLAISNLTQTSSTLKYGSITYDTNTASNVYVTDAGEYILEAKDANTFVISNVYVGAVSQHLSDVVPTLTFDGYNKLTIDNISFSPDSFPNIIYFTGGYWGTSDPLHRYQLDTSQTPIDGSAYYYELWQGTNTTNQGDNLGSSFHKLSDGTTEFRCNEGDNTNLPPHFKWREVAGTGSWESNLTTKVISAGNEIELYGDSTNPNVATFTITDSMIFKPQASDISATIKKDGVAFATTTSNTVYIRDTGTYTAEVKGSGAYAIELSNVVTGTVSQHPTDVVPSLTYDNYNKITLNQLNYEDTATVTVPNESTYNLGTAKTMYVKDTGEYVFKISGTDKYAESNVYVSSVDLAGAPTKPIDFDGYNKLTLIDAGSNVSANVTYFSNTYELGSANVLYINGAGTYDLEMSGSNVFALSSNVVNNVTPLLPSITNLGNFTLAFRHGSGTTDTSSTNCTLYSSLTAGEYDWGTVNSVTSTSTETTYNVTFSQINNVNYLVLAGGGGGSNDYPGGGGGGGGMLDGTETNIPGNTYDIVVGNGGGTNTSGTDSSFHTFTAIGGGVGSVNTGGSGGSGGGGGRGKPGGTGVAGPPRQGYNGGRGDNSTYSSGAGGGGAGGNGGNGGNGSGGQGGGGRVWSFNNVRYGGGGGGGTRNSMGGNGGSGGGGRGGMRTANGTNGTNHLGGGGGCKASGGSGTVILNFDATQVVEGSPSLTFDNYNKLTVENFTTTESDTRTGTLTDPNGDTYSLGQTQNDIYIEDTGDYILEVTNSDQSVVVTKNVGTVSQHLTDVVPSLTFDGYNKLSIENLTPTSTRLTYGSNTYEIGTASNVYIEDAGTYKVATGDATTFALVSNVVGTVSQHPTDVVPSLAYDTSNKLSIENLTPTSTTLTDPNGSSFDIGTASNVYIRDSGTYSIASKDANTFVLASNTVTGTPTGTTYVYDSNTFTTPSQTYDTTKTITVSNVPSMLTDVVGKIYKGSTAYTIHATTSSSNVIIENAGTYVSVFTTATQAFLTNAIDATQPTTTNDDTTIEDEGFIPGSTAVPTETTTDAPSVTLDATDTTVTDPTLDLDFTTTLPRTLKRYNGVTNSSIGVRFNRHETRKKRVEKSISIPTSFSAELTANNASSPTTLTVTVANSKFVINGDETPTLGFIRGETYTFDQSDASNSGHPLVLATSADGATQYTTGWTASGTPGTDGSHAFIVPYDVPDTIYYKCTNHANMGGEINTTFGNAFSLGDFTVAANTHVSGEYTLATNYDGTTSNLYVNGDLITQTTPTITAGVKEFILGKEFDGYVKNFKFWNRILVPKGIPYLSQIGSMSSGSWYDEGTTHLAPNIIDGVAQTSGEDWTDSNGVTHTIWGFDLKAGLTGAQQPHADGNSWITFKPGTTALNGTWYWGLPSGTAQSRSGTTISIYEGSSLRGQFTDTNMFVDGMIPITPNPKSMNNDI